MSILTKQLFSLSKTDQKLISFCSDNAHKTQVGYGLFVLIVGIFAFISSSYALSIALDAQWVYAIAAVYATLIMLIDREIVSVTTKNRRMVATRLVLAVFIGLVVSVPIELRIFEKQIDQQLRRTQNTSNQSYLDRKQQAEAQYRERVLIAEQAIHKLETEAGNLHNRLTNELLQPGQQIEGVVPGTGRPGEGPVYRRLLAQIEENKSQLERAQKEYQTLQADEAKELQRIDEEYRRQEIPEAKDLLSRYIALGALKRDPVQGWDAWVMAWGVRLLLIMLELTPALIKVLQEDNEYDALVRAARRRSIARVYAVVNDHMEQLAENGGQNPRPTLIEQLKTEPLTS